MTGFGAAGRENEDYKVHVEVKSVNQRYLDISFSMPRALNVFENDMRHAIKKFSARGKIDVKVARKAGLSANDLSFKLRMQGIYSVKDIKQAILEQDGQLIITSFGEENPKYPLITDGSVQKSTLEMIDKDEEWLKAELKKLGIEDASDVFLAEYDSGKISITKYEEK